MMITDAQVHIWRSFDPATRAVPLPPSFSSERLLAEMDKANVARAVLIPPGWERMETDEDRNNETSLQAAKRHPDRFAVIGLILAERPEGHALMDNWANRPRALMGIRVTFTAQDKRRDKPHHLRWTG